MMYNRVQKGRISAFAGCPDTDGNPARASVVPDVTPENITPPLVIPWWLRGQRGELAAQTEVVFVTFDDMTGIILTRADGEWPGVSDWR